MKDSRHTIGGEPIQDYLDRVFAGSNEELDREIKESITRNLPDLEFDDVFGIIE